MAAAIAGPTDYTASDLQASARAAGRQQAGSGHGFKRHAILEPMKRFWIRQSDRQRDPHGRPGHGLAVRMRALCAAMARLCWRECSDLRREAGATCAGA